MDNFDKSHLIIWQTKLKESLQKIFCKTIFVLVINSTLASANLLRFRRKLQKDLLPLHQSMMIEQAKFPFSHLGKALEKQTKTN